MTVTWALPVVLMIGVAVATLLALRHSSRGRRQADAAGTSLAAETDPRAAALLRVTRRRNLLAVGAAVGVAVIGAAVNHAYPKAYGLPAMLTPGGAAITAVLLVGLLRSTPPPRRDSVRTADLTPRRPWSYGPRWAFTLPLVGAGAVVLFAVAAGLTSSVSDDGHWRSVSLRPGSASGPYPGWFYGVPLIVMTLALAGSTLFALGRTASAPLPSDLALVAADRRARARTTQMVMRLSAGAMFAYSGAVVFFAGVTTQSAATQWTESAFVRLQPYFAVGVVEVVTGVAFGLLGGVLVLLSWVDALGLPWYLARSVAPAPANDERVQR